MQYMNTKSMHNPEKRNQLFGVSKFLLKWLWRHAICYPFKELKCVFAAVEFQKPML